MKSKIAQMKTKGRLLAPLKISSLAATLLLPACASFSGSPVGTSKSSQSAGSGEVLTSGNLASSAPLSALQIPANKGLLWFPFVWQVKLDSQTASKVGSLQIRSVNLVLLNAQKKQYVLFKMARAATGSKLEMSAANSSSKGLYQGPSNGVLDPRDDELVFVNQHSLELDEGDYNIHAVRVGFVDPNSSKTLFNDFPILNPYRPESEGNQPATVQVKAKKISAAFRLMMSTSLKKIETPTPALSGTSLAEAIDREVVPLGLVASQLGSKLTPDFFASSADIPRARAPIVEGNNQPVFGAREAAKAGMMLEYPCGMQNWLKLVWKKNSEEKEYEYAVDLNAKNQSDVEKALEKKNLEAGNSCNSVKYVEIPLTADDWQLKSSHIVDTGALPKFRTQALKEITQAGSTVQTNAPVANFLKSYFGLDVNPLLLPNTGNEKDLSKPFVLRIAKKTKLSISQPQGLLFMGKFKLVSNKEPAKNSSQTWDLLFDRTYNLKELRSGFKSDTLQNAYTLDELRKDKLLGQVNAILRVSFAGVDKKILEPVQDELRAGVAAEFKSCLLDRESTDPLVNASANLQFSLLKGTQNLSVKKSEVDGDLESGPWMKDCFEKKVLQMRLKKKAPASLQGEIVLKTE